MLHLANGESTAALLRLAEVPGEVRSVDDILMEGPLRGGLASPADLVFRAKWLEERLAIPRGDYLAHAGRRSKWAREAPTDREIVLWSEEDLFCQANLAELMGKLPLEGLRLVTPPRDDERMGAMPLERIPTLLASRRLVDPARREAAARFWAALISPDPRAIERIASEPAPPGWPQLREGARLWLLRYPSTQDGLSLLESTLVAALREQAQPFAQLFALTQIAPLAGYGMGDSQASAALRAMAQGEKPLVYTDDPRALLEARADAAWGLTDRGRAVAEGGADAVRERGIDAWLGGVHLSGTESPWRYDRVRGLLVRMPRG